MFKLKTPLSRQENKDEFDSVSVILSQSLIARPSLSKRPPLWLTSAGENGDVFHLELPAGLETKLLRLSSGDGGSVSSLALGIGCNSEDTGYSSDQDLNTSDHSCLNVFKPETVIKNEFSSIHHPKSGNTRYNSPRISLSSVSSVFSQSETHEKGRHQDFFSSKRKAFDSSVKSISNEEACDDGIFLNKSDLRSSKTSSISTNSRSSFGINNFNDGKLLPRPELTRNSKLKSKPSGGLSLSTKKRHDSLIDWKTVNVDVEVNTLKSREPLQSCHSATGAVLCEQILGIIPTCNEDSHIMGRNQSPEVIVKALTSDCDSALSSEAIVGSWLHSINGQELTWYNMDTLLSSLCKLRKVKLTLKSLKPENSTVDFEGLVHILTSDSHDQLVLDNMAAMYISLEGVSPDDPTNTKDGLAYSFPSEKNCLHQLQGMFYTLAHLIKDINKTNSIKNTVLMVDKQRMNVAYLQECSDILVFAMPASIISISQLNTLLNEYARFLRLLFGTLESVFCNKSHTAFLDAVLTYLFRQVLQTTLSSASLSAGSVFKQKLSVEASPFIRHSQHVPSLGLTDDLSIVFEKIMNEFESSDFANMSECYYGCRRQYNILGSAYIYSGHLVCSHLSPQDLRDVYVYLQHLGILDVTSRSSVAHFVAWREVYPTRFCSDIAEINNSFGYSEPNSRWCLLVVGLKHGLFCCLLETIKLSTLNPTPLTADVFYVEQAKACLLQLQAPQLLTELNLRVSKESQSDFTKSDYCATYVHTNGEKTAQLFIDNQKQRSPSSSFMLSMHSDWRSHVDNPSLINSFKTPDSSFKGSTASKGYTLTSPIHTRASNNSIPSSLSNMPMVSRISSCRNPTIYQYCYLDGLEGTFVSGSEFDTPGIFHSQIIQNFYLACRQIHDFFVDMGDKSKYMSCDSDDEECYDTMQMELHLKGAQEHGILLTFNPHCKENGLKSRQPLEYWVVGRRLKRPTLKETFVCFYASASQSVMELAFRMS